MNYIKWNKALLNHFFNPENDKNEVILYADKDLISEIGSLHNLGSYEDFLKTILVDFNDKCLIYDSIASVSGSKRSVEVTRSLKKTIVDFPNTLNELYSRRYNVIYFNYIIFFVTAYVSDEDTSYYNYLNVIIHKFLPNSRRVSSLNGLDHLLENLEKWSLQRNLGFFRARRIGVLAYKGLLNYQVVLKPDENQEFEELLYTYGIRINENTIYPELANKLLPYTKESKLRLKLKDGINKPVYAEWFLNKALQFNHAAYSKTDNGSAIVLQRKGTLTFNINSDYKLELLSDTLLNVNDKPIGFSLLKSGRNYYGYYESPLQVDGQLQFKEQRFKTHNDSLELKTLPVKEVSFFQKNGSDYIHTLFPEPNNDCIVVVENTEVKWLKWSANTENIECCSQIDTDILPSIFGQEFKFYFVQNIKKPYYKNTENLYITSTHNDGLIVKKFGGLKINKQFYLDVGLPYFEVSAGNTQELEEVKVKIYRNGAQDKDINITRKENKYYLHINGETTIDDASLVVVKFQKEKKEKSFDFSITGTNLDLSSKSELYKYDVWGDYAPNNTKYIQGTRFVGSVNIELNDRIKHTVSGLNNSSVFYHGYLIYLLVGIAISRKEKKLRYKDIIKAIDTTIIYLRSQDIAFVENKYSRFQLINNLIALGYINYKLNKKEEKEFQLVPFGVRKIEKSFNNISQIYQVTGVYSRLLLDSLKTFCNEHQIEIKYKSSYSENSNSLENVLLPDIIYIDLKNKVHLLESLIKEEFEQDLLVDCSYNLGDSLLNFIASLSVFEQAHLRNPVNLQNQELFNQEKDQFPRIVETNDDYRRYGSYYSKKFLEKERGKYYKINHPHWTKLFIQYKRINPILFLKRRYGQGSFNYSKEVLIPSSIHLPEIVYRSLCILNHGIPITKKIFWINAPIDTLFSMYTFKHYDFYQISDIEGKRRKNMARILTGTEDLNSNPQLRFLKDHNSKYNLSYIKCTVLSDFKSAIFIEDDNEYLVGLYFGKQLYLNATFTGKTEISGIKLIINKNKFYNLMKVKTNGFSENDLLSKALGGDFKDFEFISVLKELKIQIDNKDFIEIRELQ